MRWNLFVCALLIVFPIFCMGQDGYEKIKDKEGIKIYLRRGESLYELKAVKTMETSLRGLTAVVYDADNYKNWIYRAVISKKLKTISDTSYVYYLYSDLPWPAPDQDMVVKMKISRMKDGSVKTISKRVAGYMDKTDAIRMQYVDVSWHFKPLSSGNIEVHYYTKFDPGADLPDWIENKIFTLGPTSTFTNLEKFSKKPKYAKKALPGFD
jgi:hypothetical protein